MKTILLIAFLCASAFASETNLIPSLTIGDRTFTNATIRKSTPTTVIVRDDAGFGSVAITNLPEPWISRFLDTNEIAAIERKKATQRERDAARAQSMGAAYRRENFVLINGRLESRQSLDQIFVDISSVDPDGIIGTEYRFHEIYRSGHYIGSKEIRGGKVFARNFKGGSVGKRETVRANKLGTIEKKGEVLELWDCGTLPQ